MPIRRASDLLFRGCWFDPWPRQKKFYNFSNNFFATLIYYFDECYRHYLPVLAHNDWIMKVFDKVTDWAQTQDL